MSRDCSDEGRPSANTRASILSVLHASGASPLTLLGVRDEHLPPELLERVVHEPRARHRLDHRPNPRTPQPFDEPRCNMKTGLLELAPRSHAGACHRGGRLSSQSKAGLRPASPPAKPAARGGGGAGGAPRV